MKMDIPPLQQIAGRALYLGPEGSFTHSAARQFFGPDFKFEAVPESEITRRVNDALGREPNVFGVLPYQNITAGFIETTFDSLYRAAKVQIIGELIHPVRMCLLSTATSLKQITTVMSHKVGLAQCRNSLARLEAEIGHPLKRDETTSTSAAVKVSADDKTGSVAALGSPEAGVLYGVPALRANMQDHPHNATRFWAFGTGQRPAYDQGCTTMFLVELANTSTSLVELLDLLNRQCGVWVTSLKLHGIPHMSTASEWAYCYFVACKGHVDDAPVAAAWRALRRADWPVLRGRAARLLGSFPTFEIHKPIGLQS